MDLNRYVEDLRLQFMAAAEAAGADAEQVAERLVATLQATTRLVLLDALSTAAAEITSDLAPGSVELRLRGLDPEFVVTAPVADSPDDPAPTAARAPAPPAAGARAGDDHETSRLTLRLPEPVKVRIEEAAAADGLSVNSWLVRTLTSVLEPTERAPASRPTPTGGERFTGWAR